MEALIKWNEKFNTGNFVIDYQNQRLVRFISDLDEVRRHEELKPSLLKLILDEVSNYTRYHFKTEEEIMDTVNYSEKDKRKGQHREFIQSLNLFANDYELGKKDIDKTFCEFLKNWITNHITAEDKKLLQKFQKDMAWLNGPLSFKDFFHHQILDMISVDTVLSPVSTLGETDYFWNKMECSIG